MFAKLDAKICDLIKNPALNPLPVCNPQWCAGLVHLNYCFLGCFNQPKVSVDDNFPVLNTCVNSERSPKALRADGTFAFLMESLKLTAAVQKKPIHRWL